MLRVRCTASMVVLVALVSPVPTAGAKSTGSKSVKCKASQVRVTVAKKSRCVKATVFKPQLPKVDRSVAATKTLTAAAGVKLPAVKLKNGKSYKGQFSAGESAGITNFVSVAQQRLRAAALDAAHAQLGIGGSDGSSPAGPVAKSAAVARAAAADVTFGEPKVNVTVDQASGTANVTGSIDGTVNLDGGATATVEVTVGGTVGGAAGADGELSFEVGGTVNEKSGSTARKVKLTLDQSARRASCPDASGRIEYIAPYKGSSGGTQTFKAGPITYGTVSDDIAVSSRVNSVVMMKDDATLPKVEFLVSYETRIKQKAKLLGIPLKNVSITMSVTAQGSLDAHSGATDPGMRFNVSVRAQGVSGRDAASIKQQLTEQAESSTRTALGELAAQMRKVESAAQGGSCTKLDLNPQSGTLTLGADETNPGVMAHLSATADGGKDVTPKVTWTLTPQVGKATNTSAGANPMTMSVTGAQANPDAVSVQIKAVSHAGISQTTWTAKAKPPFPKSYSGPVSFHSLRTNPVNTSQTNEKAGQATVGYTLTSTQSFSDGTMTAWYDLTSLNISSVTYKDTDGGCTMTVPPFAPGPVDDSGDALVLSIAPDGSWTYMASAYHVFGIMQATSSCPNPPQSVVPIFDFRTRPATGSRARPMSPRGAISGNDPTGIFSGATDIVAGATWALTPSD